jgi:NAD(P)-dependent dehydrogenase (short-subunit alcohol dehydrogenase family)
MEGELEGKVAIVTGGIRGIGKAIGIAFAREGAKVALFDLDVEDSRLAGKLQEAVGAFNKKCLYKKADVTQMKEIRQAVEETVTTFGKVDILVNNAGGSFIAPAPIEDLEEKDWDLVVNVNLKGTYICTHAVMKQMKKQKRGKIINISSKAGRAPGVITPLPYVCAKAAVIQFTRQLALDVSSFGINVNGIAPGTISVERVNNMFEDRYLPEERQRILDDIPLKRMGKPEEIAELAVYLASEKSSFMTGVTIDINGGTFMN